jgi:hypothetical protein
MRRDLNQHIRLWQIDTVVTYFADTDRLHHGIVLKLVQNPHPLRATGVSVDVRFHHFTGERLSHCERREKERTVMCACVRMCAYVCLHCEDFSHCDSQR